MTDPITPVPPHVVRTPLVRQQLRDVVFVHWETEVDAVRRWLPAGTVPDHHDGRAYLGLVGLRARTFLPGGVPLPHLGSFAQVNVRLYCVDADGRRGVVFRSLDAGRLAPVLAARAGYRLPYFWSDVEHRRGHGGIGYRVRRRWPARPVRSEIVVRTGPRLAAPGSLDHFLTARWMLHWGWAGRTLRCPISHQPWELYAAEVQAADHELVVAAGLPVAGEPPASVLWSPGVDVRLGRPETVSP